MTFVRRLVPPTPGASDDRKKVALALLIADRAMPAGPIHSRRVPPTPNPAPLA
ncbi:hypothetical protein D3C85_1588210 [compost metagenome]